MCTMDVFDKKKRSWAMSRVKSKDTLPEMRVRSALHRMGLRFRLHDKSLPGSPDLVFAGRKTVLFVHGCFWHQHMGCPHSKRPTTNSAFWEKKLNRNMQRDMENVENLEGLRWKVIIVWECEINNQKMMEVFSEITSREN
jgi:DNA mismatch endonuclease, patch repair protein